MDDGLMITKERKGRKYDGGGAQSSRKTMPKRVSWPTVPSLQHLNICCGENPD